MRIVCHKSLDIACTYTLIQNRGILYFIQVLDMTNTVTFLASDL